MKLNCNDFSTQKTWESDVCIMGAGVAGITLANELREKGVSVILLEAGGDSYDQAVQDIAKANSVTAPYADPSQSRLRFLGGASNHWSNNTSPLSEIDFIKRDGLPNSGWPITKRDLDPYYAKAAAYCGTGEDGYDLSYWHEKFGVKPTISEKQSSGITLSMAKASIPPTQFYRAHGSKLNESEHVTVITYAQVTNVSFNPVQKELDSIEVTGPNGIVHRVVSKEVIMAFGGIENARMLLHFNQKHNGQLGNQGDSVGRYFMDHPTFRGAQIYTKTPDIFTMFKGEMLPDYKRFALNFFELSESTLVKNNLTNLRLPLIAATRKQLSHGLSSFHLMKERFSGKQVSSSIAADITNLVMDYDIVADAISRKTTGEALFESVDDFGGFQVPLMMEQTPHRDNRISLSKKKDRFGIPMLNIDWKLHDDDKTRVWRGLNVFSSELGALGIGRVRSLESRASRIFEDQIGFGHHHMGSTRMSTSPESGVVDSEQRVFGVGNFSIAGCSVFSTGGHVPPTLTIAATSIRLADIVAKRIGSRLS